jgi:hypothetical protein
MSPYGRATWHLFEHATWHPSSGDMCHLWVGPHQLYNLPIVPLPCVTLPRQHDVSVDFFIVDLFDLFPVWKNDHSALTLAYNVHLRKKIYGQNQCDETVAMELVSFDYDNFHF